MNIGISDKAFNEIKKIFSKYNIDKKVIFGSRARGSYRYNSDIDIAVFGEIDRNAFVRLYGELKEADCIYKIDLVHFDRLTNEKLKQDILKEGIEF